MPGMSTNLGGPNGEITDHIIRWYEERAKGGTGLIITEFTTIDYEWGRGAVNQLRIDQDRFVPGFHRLANHVHKYGAKIFVQLHHAGRESNSMLTGGKQIVAPSPVICEAIGEEPRELTTSEVKEIIRKFIKGAVRVKLAGMDGVELHGAHGYLINQFLSPNTNLRTDEYGGSFENRLRFLKEIIIGIKDQCGNDFPVIVRLSVDEFDEGGMDIHLSREVASYLEKIGVDGLHASAGNYNSMDKVIESPLFEQGWRVYLAEELKKVVQIPVIAVGSIREPKYVESILADGKADFVAMGRGHIAEPEWVHKVSEGREKEIRFCISCLHCVYSKTAHIECSTNVRAGRELEFKDWQRISDKRKVVVVGGGPGGMEAARVLAEKGYDVTLFEQINELGGQLRLVTEPVYKKKMKWYLDYLSYEMERLKVDVRLQMEATVDRIQSLQPYAVLLATGAKPYLPDVEGLDLPHVSHYLDVKIENKVFHHNKIAVLGSGMVCFSTVRRLAEQGNQVTLVELPKKSGKNISQQTRKRLIDRLIKMNIEVVTGCKLLQILPSAIRLEEEKTGDQKLVEADQVVIAMGVQPYNPLEKSLRQVIDPVFVIGDAAGYASLSDATRGGFEKAFVIESLVLNHC